MTVIIEPSMAEFIKWLKEKHPDIITEVLHALSKYPRDESRSESTVNTG